MTLKIGDISMHVMLAKRKPCLVSGPRAFLLMSYMPFETSPGTSIADPGNVVGFWDLNDPQRPYTAARCQPKNRSKSLAG